MSSSAAHRRPGAGASRLLAGAVLCGIAAGLVGMAMALFIDLVERVAFGRAVSSGWQGVAGIPAARVLSALVAGGLVSGLAWWRIRPPGRTALPTVKDAVRGEPLGPVTLVDAAAQLLVVGTGASIGREAAPRQASAWAAQSMCRGLGLDAAQRRLLVGAAAGAGLAAVYNTPVAGAAMAVEIFLRPDLRTRTGRVDALVSLLTSCIATVVAWPVVGRHPVYDTPRIGWSWWLVPLALGMAVVAESVGDLFGTLARHARAHSTPRQRLCWSVPLASLAVGLVALVAPQVVGNGRPLVQAALDHPATAWVLAGLTLAKAVATPLSLRGGASGGMLTPALAVGAGLGATLSLAVAPHADAGVRAAAALTGAVVVLAVTQHAPWFAMVFVAELSHPTAPGVIALAVAVSTGFGIHMARHAAVNAWRERHGRPPMRREAG